ncbi:MAG: cupin domain-containing protein [Patescibacteria group bacterium]
MGTTINTGFGTFVFDDTLPSPAGDIPYRPLGSMTPRGVNVMCGLEAGRSYEPEKHPYSCLVIVVEGSGVFVRDGKRLSYAPGSSFRLNAHMFHGFVSVETATVFIKQARPSKPQPA